MIIKDLFLTLADFGNIVPGVDTGVTFANLESSAVSAKKQITSIITEAVYTAVVADTGEKKAALLSAMGNLIMAKDNVFDVLRKRKNEVAVYKAEQEAMRRAYMDNYYNAMDTLIYLLSDDSTFKATAFCKLLDELKIKTAADFNAHYPIDNSYFFFFRIIPFQKEILDDLVSDYFDRVSDLKQISKLNRALAQLTVSLSLKRLDPLDFPSSIRNMFDDSKAYRHGTAEQSRLLELSNDLYKSGTEILQTIEETLKTPDADMNIVSDTSFNEPDDQIFSIV